MYGDQHVKRRHRIAQRVPHRPPVHKMPLTTNSRIDHSPGCQSLLICSNSSTRDLAIPDLHADTNDVTIRSRVGPEFATTRRPTRPGEITTQAGPKFATKQAQTGASSGDHTQPSSSRPGRPSATRRWCRARPPALGSTAASRSAASRNEGCRRGQIGRAHV